MAQQVSASKVSSSNEYVGDEQLHQYVFIIGEGSNRSSETRHMTEAQARAHKSKLGA